jgi:putative effector of murein hydrolase LrgA (UPF0299 family)
MKAGYYAAGITAGFWLGAAVGDAVNADMADAIPCAVIGVIVMFAALIMTLVMSE